MIESSFRKRNKQLGKYLGDDISTEYSEIRFPNSINVFHLSWCYRYSPEFKSVSSVSSHRKLTSRDLSSKTKYDLYSFVQFFYNNITSLTSLYTDSEEFLCFYYTVSKGDTRPNEVLGKEGSFSSNPKSSSTLRGPLTAQGTDQTCYKVFHFY